MITRTKPLERICAECGEETYLVSGREARDPFLCDPCAQDLAAEWLVLRAAATARTDPAPAEPRDPHQSPADPHQVPSDPHQPDPHDKRAAELVTILREPFALPHPGVDVSLVVCGVNVDGAGIAEDVTADDVVQVLRPAIAAELRRASAEGEARGLERAADYCRTLAATSPHCQEAALRQAGIMIRALKAVPRG